MSRPDRGALAPAGGSGTRLGSGPGPVDGSDPGPLPEDETVWQQPREVGLVGGPPRGPALAYRFLRLVGVVVRRGILGFRIEVEGREHLPVDERGRRAGGWIAAALPHRTWVDPFVLVVALPASPRLAFFGWTLARPRRSLGRQTIGWRPGGSRTSCRRAPQPPWLPCEAAESPAGTRRRWLWLTHRWR
jgi:hypothetical protein